MVLMKSVRFLLFAILAISSTPAWAMGTEEIGNAPLSKLNYSDWKGIAPVVNDASRVYQNWVNGNEHLYYEGDVNALNAFLQKFRAADLKAHEVILQPGPGTVSTFQHDKTFSFHWVLHIVGGISKHQTKLDQGEKIWSDSPQVTIYFDEKLDLEKLKIPAGVHLLDTATLSRRWREALKSTDISVRGWGAAELARLDSHNEENLKAVGALLDDKDEWVQLNIIGALPVFGKKAEPYLPKLKEMPAKADKHRQTALADAIRKIEEAREDPAKEKTYLDNLKRISEFIRNQADSKPQ